MDGPDPHHARAALRDERLAQLNRRAFLGGTAGGLGALALAGLLDPASLVPKPIPRPGPGPGPGPAEERRLDTGGLPGLPHFAPRAKRVIYLHQSGAPAQLDLLDHKPGLAARRGLELPDSVRDGQRLTGMTSEQSSFPVAPSHFKFRRHGESGNELSELLPHTAAIADELLIVRSMHTEAINHDPAITFIQTGFQQPGRPSLGAWLSYGLGSENADLPAFVVLISQGSSKRDSQPLFARLWGSGFLSGDHQGVPFRAGADPVLYLSDPPGVDRPARRRMLDTLAELNSQRLARDPDPQIAARIAQY